MRQIRPLTEANLLGRLGNMFRRQPTSPTPPTFSAPSDSQKKALHSVGRSNLGYQGKGRERFDALPHQNKEALANMTRANIKLRDDVNLKTGRPNQIRKSHTRGDYIQEKPLQRRAGMLEKGVEHLVGYRGSPEQRRVMTFPSKNTGGRYLEKHVLPPRP